MPRQKSLMTVIRDLVQQEVRAAMQSLLGGVSTAKPRRRTGAAVAGVGVVLAGRGDRRTRRSQMANAEEPGRSCRSASRRSFTVASGCIA